MSTLWVALLGLVTWTPTNQQRSPGSGAHPGAELRCRRPNWSLLGDRSREISEKRPTPRTNRQAGCLAGAQLQGKGRPHGRGAGGRFTPDGLRSGGEWASRAERPRPCGEAWKRRGAACQAPREAGPHFPASLAGGFAPRLCSHTLWLDRLVPGGGSGPQTFPQLLAPGCKTLRGPTIRRLREVLPPPCRQQWRGRRTGTWHLPDGVGLETPEAILTSLPSFCLPGSDGLLDSPVCPWIFLVV